MEHPGVDAGGVGVEALLCGGGGRGDRRNSAVPACGSPLASLAPSSSHQRSAVDFGLIRGADWLFVLLLLGGWVRCSLRSTPGNSSAVRRPGRREPSSGLRSSSPRRRGRPSSVVGRKRLVLAPGASRQKRVAGSSRSVAHGLFCRRGEMAPSCLQCESQLFPGHAGHERSDDHVSTIARVLESVPPDVTQLSRSCPPGLAQLIGTCLQKQPEQRFGATVELVEALQELRRDLVASKAGQSSKSKKATVEGTRRRSPRSPVWSVAVSSSGGRCRLLPHADPAMEHPGVDAGGVGVEALLCGGGGRGDRRNSAVPPVVHLSLLSHRARRTTTAVVLVDPRGRLVVCTVAFGGGCAARCGARFRVLSAVRRPGRRDLHRVYDHRARDGAGGLQASSVENVWFSHRAQVVKSGSPEAVVALRTGYSAGVVRWRRAASNVKVSFSLGTPVTNGRMIMLSGKERLRLSVMFSHCM